MLLGPCNIFLPHSSMIEFLSPSNILLDDPKRLMDDELLMLKGDNSLKLALLKMTNTLVSVRTWVLARGSKTAQNRPASNEEEKGLMAKVGHSLTILDVIRDSYIWEQLNIGHWKTVSPSWKRAYTFLCICKTIFMAVLGKPSVDIIKECDMGLLMGEPILNNALLCFAQNLSISEIIGKEVESEINEAVTVNPILFQDVSIQVQFPESRFEIKSIENPSLQQFSDVMKSQIPILIIGGIEHWPARRKWSVEYIRKIAGFRTVPVEIGSKYTSDDWTQKLMTVEDFINSHIITHNSKSGVGYIAQHRLFEQITELGDDIKIPDYCLLGESKQVEINAWFGPGNTISPTHYDPKHNILVQVFGTKLIRLYPPSASRYLMPFPATSILFNTSQIDVEDSAVPEKYPGLKNANYCEFILLPGMMLYIPPKWWHYVKSLTPSFSISFWFE